MKGLDAAGEGFLRVKDLRDGTVDALRRVNREQADEIDRLRADLAEAGAENHRPRGKPALAGLAPDGSTAEDVELDAEIGHSRADQALEPRN